MWLLVCVTGIVGVQLLAKFFSTSHLPGAARGDLILKESSLPAELAGWKLHQFVPATAAESLPQGQFWWVHLWQYIRGPVYSLVAFDQLGDSQWHELTHCYYNQGWKVALRTIVNETDDQWPYVVAEFEKGPRERAVLVFSLFYEDGSPASPPSVNLLRLNSGSRKPGFTERAHDRVDPVIEYDNPFAVHSRVLQSQVFVPGVTTEFAETRQAAIELHLQARILFRGHWLKHASTHPVFSAR